MLILSCACMFAVVLRMVLRIDWPQQPLCYSALSAYHTTAAHLLMLKISPHFPRLSRAGLRQLAAVLLKHLIQRHWTSGSPSFEQPEISAQEKAAVRPKLLELLFQVPSNVSTPLAVCATSIATWDFPDEWPDLLQKLLSAVRADPSDASQVRRSTPLHAAARHPTPCTTARQHVAVCCRPPSALWLSRRCL